MCYDFALLSVDKENLLQVLDGWCSRKQQRRSRVSGGFTSGHNLESSVSSMIVNRNCTGDLKYSDLLLSYYQASSSFVCSSNFDGTQTLTRVILYVIRRIPHHSSVSGETMAAGGLLSFFPLMSFSPPCLYQLKYTRKYKRRLSTHMMCAENVYYFMTWVKFDLPLLSS